jgi:hypothetical protein
MAETERPYFTPGFPLWKPLEKGSRIESLDDGATGTAAAEAEPDPIRSDTGELAWSWSKADAGQVQVDTPRTQALIGFATSKGGSLTNMSAEVTNPFSVMVLTSLDDQPIAHSSKVLLVAAARAVNTAMDWNATHTGLTQWGSSPTLIEPITGTLTLRNLAGATAVAAQPLDGAGRLLGEPISAVHKGNTWQIPLGTPVTTWYAVTVKR